MIKNHRAVIATQGRFCDPIAVPGFAIAAIIRDVARQTGLSPANITGRDKHRPVVRARQATMLRARLAGFSFPAIAAAFGTHHTSVMHAVRMAAKHGAQA